MMLDVEHSESTFELACTQQASFRSRSGWIMITLESYKKIGEKTKWNLIHKHEYKTLKKWSGGDSSVWLVGHVGLLLKFKSPTKPNKFINDWIYTGLMINMMVHLILTGWKVTNYDMQRRQWRGSKVSFLVNLILTWHHGIDDMKWKTCLVSSFSSFISCSSKIKQACNFPYLTTFNQFDWK